MRLLVRAFFVIVPWVLFVATIGAVFQPKTGADWLLTHWLLIPFVPVYTLVVSIAFHFTRPTPEHPYIQKLKQGQRSNG